VSGAPDREQTDVRRSRVRQCPPRVRGLGGGSREDLPRLEVETWHRGRATLYTILETVKLHDVDPTAYLIAAIEAAERGEALLPWQFAAQR
jgi:hypothetical protein